MSLRRNVASNGESNPVSAGNLRTRSRQRYTTLAAPIVIATMFGLSGCSDDDEDVIPTETGGTTGVGGTTGRGGTSSVGGTATKGGTTGAGGAAQAGSSGKATGGAPASGGQPAAGSGGVASGGIAGGLSGGTSNAGTAGSPVDTAGNAGTAGSGGIVIAPTGGTQGIGGAVSTGGTVSIGGAVSTAGTAGTVATGGTVASAGAGGAEAGGPSITGGVAGETSTGEGGVSSPGGAAGEGQGGAAGSGSDNTAGTAGTAGTGSTPPVAILQYMFEDGSGTVANDETSNNNDANLSTVTFSANTAGRNGAAASFADAASSISVPPNLFASTHALTIAGWVKPSAAVAADTRLFEFGNGTTFLRLNMNGTNGAIALEFQGTTGGLVQLGLDSSTPATPTQFPIGIWKHVAVTVSTSGSAIYVDGKIVASSAAAVDPALLVATNNLIGNSPAGTNALQGLIDEFYVYDGVLPLADIRNLAAPKTDYTIYHLDEGTGTATAESSDRHLNGTLVGGATWVTSPFGTGVGLANDPATTPAQQYVTLPDGIIPATPASCGTTGTFSAWIRLTTNGTNAPVFQLGADDTHFTNMSTYAAGTGQILSFYWINGSRNATVRKTGLSYTLNKWMHIAAVRSDDSAGIVGRFEAVYLDGVVQSTAALSTSAGFATSTPLSYLGRSHSATVPGFNGAIDEVLFACRRYTEDEIKQLAYQPPTP